MYIWAHDFWGRHQQGFGNEGIMIAPAHLQTTLLVGETWVAHGQDL